MTDPFWQRFWQIAAVFNLINAIPILINFELYYSLLGMSQYVPEDPTWMLISAWVIAMFGIAYYAVSRNLSGHRDIIVLGIVGKLGVWFIVSTSFLLGTERVPPLIMVLMAQLDFMFSLFFIRFLRLNNKLSLTQSATIDSSAQPSGSDLEFKAHSDN